MIESFKAEQTEAGLSFDVRFESRKRFHCLVGVNGVGKTHLIEHLARALLYSHAMFRAVRDGVHSSGLFFLASIRTELAPLEARLAEEISVDRHVVRSKASGNGAKVRLEQFPRGQSGLRVDQPIVFVGARERGHTSNILPNQLRLLGDAEERFTRAFIKTWHAATGQALPVEEPSEWFSSRLLINPAFAVGNEVETEAVVDVLMLLQALDPKSFEGWLVLDPPRRTLGLGYVDGSLRMGEAPIEVRGRPIDKLATGYIAALKIFQEIIAGYAGWAAVFPKGSVRNLRELDGVVFIDEIEAHLHPLWQSRLVRVLKESFPNTTFFVTTHSPLVVRNTEPGEAIEILRDGDRVTSRTLGSPRDWYLADVYAEGFHVDVPPPGQDAPDGERPLTDVMLDFSNAVREFAATRDVGGRATALALHQSIDARLSPDDPRRRSLAALRELLG